MPIHSTAYIDTTPSLTLDRLYNRSSSTPSSLLTVCSRTTALPSRRLNTLALNPKHAGDTYYNYSKVGYCLPNYTLPYTPYLDLKEL